MWWEDEQDEKIERPAYTRMKRETYDNLSFIGVHEYTYIYFFFFFLFFSFENDVDINYISEVEYNNGDVRLRIVRFHIVLVRFSEPEKKNIKYAR